jgi:hypothetical protein
MRAGDEEAPSLFDVKERLIFPTCHNLRLNCKMSPIMALVPSELSTRGVGVNSTRTLLMRQLNTRNARDGSVIHHEPCRINTGASLVEMRRLWSEKKFFQTNGRLALNSLLTIKRLVRPCHF